MPVGAEIAEIDVGKILVGHFLDIGAGGESLVGAGDDQAADGGVGVERRNRRGELAH